MIKIFDMDELFDKYISDFVYKNIGKIKPEEIEDQIPVLYEKFGNEKLKELDEKTPNQYYVEYSAEELLECLKGHLEKQVPVSDFLCEAIQNNKANEDVLLKELNQDSSEELTLYLMNMLDAMGSKKGAKRYLEFVLWDYSLPIKELATELLCNFADEVKEEILFHFKDSSTEIKSYLTQILSNSSKDDRIFDLLIAEFAKNQKDIPIYAGYLARYGDERALPFLMQSIESDKINYFDFEELRFAIEALGGEYNKKRDFSSDRIYKKIQSAKNQAPKK